MSNEAKAALEVVDTEELKKLFASKYNSW